jgi:hypothetical protein
MDRSVPLLLEEEVVAARHASSRAATWRWVFPGESAPLPATPQRHRLEDRMWPFRRPSQAAITSDAPCIPALSLRYRVLGFAACFVLGSVLSLGSISSFGSLVRGNPGPFAFQFSCGNLLSTLSTGFIVGFRTQLRSMAQQHRALSAAAYLLSMLATLGICLATAAPHPLVVLLCIVIQYAAMVWYIASYIPFGRSMLSSCCRGCVRHVMSSWDESL